MKATPTISPSTRWGRCRRSSTAGTVVTECAAICAYLADAFPEAGLAPRAEERADYYRWLFFAAGPVERR